MRLAVDLEGKPLRHARLRTRGDHKPDSPVWNRPQSRTTVTPSLKADAGAIGRHANNSNYPCDIGRWRGHGPSTRGGAPAAGARIDDRTSRHAGADRPH